ncbi:MAG: uroporphyrinogen decarboxylase [Leptolyngbya sp.]|nr:uroporphyrinogen decarboxylase [Candidatus Melainabacteria bacterium]
MKALRREKAETTPIWLMRQAGRFMPEYREIRSKMGFLELCHNPQVCAEVTCMAVDMLNVDAAIIFSDILLPLQSLGCELEFVKGDGPVIHKPVRNVEDVANLLSFDCAESLSYVLDAIKLTRKELPAHIPLIGFAGAPFTLASYLIEGGSSRSFEKTKRFMYAEPAAWHQLMKILSKIVSEHLTNQVNAGAQAVQIFDSWVGCLSRWDYAEYVYPHLRETVANLNKIAPVIYFGTDTAHLLSIAKGADVDMIGVDWRCDLDEAWRTIGHDKAIQGNLDPVILYADKQTIRERVEQILGKAKGRPGHVFNLGHGVLPQTPVDNVKYLVELVRELSAKQ